MRIAIFLICLFLSAGLQANSSGFAGYWVASNFSSVIRIDPCDEGKSLCAELVWLFDVGVAGRRMLDSSNPDESLRERPMVGLSLFSRMILKDDVWKGRIYNPEDGRHYRASVTRRDANRLRVRGCWGPFCKRQTWRRLSSVRVPTQDQLERARR